MLDKVALLAKASLKNVRRHFPRHAALLSSQLRWVSFKLRRPDAEFQALLSRLKAADDPIAELNIHLAHSSATLQQAAAAIQHIFSERDPAFIRLCTSTSSAASPLNVLLNLYKGEYQGLSPDANRLQDDWRRLEQSCYKPTALDRLYFLIAAIKSGSLPLVDTLLTSMTKPGAPELPSAHKVGVLRLVMRQAPQEYLKWRQRLNLTALEALQIAELDTNFCVGDVATHLEFSQRFTFALPRHLKNELRASVLPFFDRHRDKAIWMDCRLRADARAAFLDLVRQALVTKTPWSLIRLGDGESYAWLEKLSDEQIAMREQVWWGMKIEPELRRKIADRALEAITHADVLGVPSMFRFARDTTRTLTSYHAHRSITGLLNVISGITQLPPSPRVFTEERIHQVCFDLSAVLSLCKSASKVIVVSSIATCELSRCFLVLDATAVEFVEVPTHTKTRGNRMFSSVGVPLPYCYEAIDQDLAMRVIPGALVIVAGGLIGKIFCETARKNGAVAIDVGAMADYWIGVKSRSIADLI